MSKRKTEPGIYTQEIQWLDAKSMLDKRNRLNWREHPKRQRQRFMALKGEIGWAGVILVNEITGNVVDGHMRLEEAAKANEVAPFLFGRWTKDQEAILLLQHDSIGMMAKTNRDALANLTEMVKKGVDALKEKNPTKELEKILQTTQDLADFSEREESDAPLIEGSKKRIRLKRRKSVDIEDNSIEGDYDGSIYEEPKAKSSIIFPSDLPYGLPPLLPDRIATPDMLPRRVWDGEGQRKGEFDESYYYCVSRIAALPENRSGGCLGFFTEDHRFEDTYCFSDTFLADLQEEDWTMLLAPEFSTYWNWPLAARIWNVYRSRWVARYWQEAGFYVTPVLQDLCDKSGIQPDRIKQITDTLPSPCPTLALQTHSLRDVDWKRFHKQIAIVIDRIKPEAVLIYGAEHRKYYEGYLPAKVGKHKIEYILLESFIHIRQNRSKKR